jgi:small subunit ribosomal protein S18
MVRKAKLKISSRLLKKKARKSSSTTRKNCRFVTNKDLVKELDYKNPDFLKGFLTERGKILPARISGNSAKYQRILAREIKKARAMALLPYSLARY